MIIYQTKDFVMDRYFANLCYNFIYKSNNKYLLFIGLIVAEVLIDLPLNLALIQWYDFKSKRNPYLYRCPHLKLIELYNFVAIESIYDVVHIVPCFDKQNEYFVNKYIF